MYTLGEKLTSVATVDQLLCIGHGGRPVETYSESFADQGPRGGVIAASTTVDFMQQLNTYFLSNTLHQNFNLCIFVHQDIVDQYVLLTAAHEPIVLCSISISGRILQKLDKGTLQSLVLVVGGTAGAVEKDSVMPGGGTVATRGWCGSFLTT
jgi:hypothetical protein